jgi:hypothetical protein
MARNNIHQFVAKKRAEKLEELLPYDLGDLLIGALERELAEPLDWIEMPEEQARRIRESF